MLNGVAGQVVDLLLRGAPSAGRSAGSTRPVASTSTLMPLYSSLDQHVDQRHLQVREQVGRARPRPAARPGSAAAARAAGRPRPRSRSPARTGTSSIRFWFLPAADQLVDLDRRVVQVALGQVVEVVVPLAGVEQVAGHHRVERHAGQTRRRQRAARSCRTSGSGRSSRWPGSPAPGAGPPASRFGSSAPLAGRRADAAGTRPRRSFQAKESPTSSAHRGQTLVVSVSTEMTVCCPNFGRRALRRPRACRRV